MITLNEDDKNALKEIMDMGAWASVLKVADIAVQHQEHQLLNCGVGAGGEKPEEIFLRKAKYEGAKLVRALFQGQRKELNRMEKP
jgi:hypothetical protein